MMTFVDIAIRILLGMGAVGALAYCFLAVIAPVLTKIGESISPDRDEAGQFAIGFLSSVFAAVLLAGVWFLGDYLASLLSL